MRAVKLIGPRQMDSVDVDMPEADGEHVIVKISACGICGSDLHYWDIGVGMNGLPGLIMGHEFCGTVHDPGIRDDLSSGDRVTVMPINPCGECTTCSNGWLNICMNANKRSIPGNNSPGAFAEYVSARPDMVRTLPDNISDKEGALVEPSTVALHAVNQTELKAGESLLVIGGGPIGLLCAAWGKIKGASRVVLVEMNKFRQTFAGNTGWVDEVVNAADQKLGRTLRALSDGGFDRTVETSASDAGIGAAISALKPHGRIVLAGISFHHQPVHTLMLTMKELEMRTSMGFLPEEFDMVIDHMTRKKLNVETLVTKTVALENIPDTFNNLSSGAWKEIKITLAP